MHLKNSIAFILVLLIFLFSYGYAAELCMLDPNASKAAMPVSNEQLSTVLNSMKVVLNEIAKETSVQPNLINGISITLAAEENPRRDVRLSYQWPERMLLTISDNIKVANSRNFIVYPYEVKIGDEEIQNLSKPIFAVEGALKQYFDNGKFKIEITGDEEPYVLSLSADFSEFEKVPERIDGTINFSYKDAFFERQPSIEVRIEKNPCKTLAEDSESYLLALNSLSECHNLAAGITKIAFLELFLRHYKYYYPSEGYEAHLRGEIKNATPEEKEKNMEYFDDSEALLKYDSWILSSYGKSISYLEEAKAIAALDETSTLDDVAEGAVAVENARKNEWLAYKEFRKDPFDPDYREAWVDSVVALKRLEKEFGIVANLPKEEQAKEISDEELAKQTTKEINENYGYDGLLVGNLTQLQIEIGEQIELMSEAQKSMLEKAVEGVTSVLTLKVFPENQEKLQMNIAHLESEKRGVGYIIELLQGKLDVPIVGNPGEETKNLSKQLEDEKYAAIKGNRLSILQINEIAKLEREKLGEELKGYYPINWDSAPEDAQMKVRALQRFEKYWNDIYAALDGSANSEVRKRLYVVDKDFIQNINEADFLLGEVTSLETEQENLNALIAAFEERADKSKWDVSVFRIALDTVKQNKEKAIAEAGRLQIQSNGIEKIVKLLEDGNSWAQIGAINNDAEIQTAATGNETVQFLIVKDSLLREAQKTAADGIKNEDLTAKTNKEKSRIFSQIVKKYLGGEMEKKQAELAFNNAERYENYSNMFGIEALRLRAYEEYIQTAISFCNGDEHCENGELVQTEEATLKNKDFGRLAGYRAAKMNSALGRFAVSTRAFIEGITTPKMIVTLGAISAAVRGFVIIQGAKELGTMESFLARANLRSADYTAKVRALAAPKQTRFGKLKEFVFKTEINPIPRAFPKASLNYWTNVATNKLGMEIFRWKYSTLPAAEWAVQEAKITGLIAFEPTNRYIPIRPQAELSTIEVAGTEFGVSETADVLFYYGFSREGRGVLAVVKSVEGEGGVLTLRTGEIANLARKTRELPRVFKYLQEEGFATAEDVQYAQILSGIFDNAAQRAGAPLEAAVPASFEAFTKSEAIGYIESLIAIPKSGELPALLQMDGGFSAIAGRGNALIAGLAADAALAEEIPDFVSALPASITPELLFFKRRIAGFTTGPIPLLKYGETIYGASDNVTYVDATDGKTKPAINAFGTHQNFLAELWGLYQRNPVFRDFFNYTASRTRMSPDALFKKTFNFPSRYKITEKVDCSFIACHYRRETGIIIYRFFKSYDELYAFARYNISANIYNYDVRSVMNFVSKEFLHTMAHEESHQAWYNMPPNVRNEWLTHVKMALEGKINDQTVRRGFNYLYNSSYSTTSFEIKADELLAFKVKNLSYLISNREAPGRVGESFIVTSYDLWFLRKNGILSEQTYQTLLKNPNIVYLGKDAFYTGSYAYSSSGLQGGRTHAVSAEACEFGCEMQVEQLSANELTISPGSIKSGENLIEAEAAGTGGQVGVRIANLERVERIEINSGSPATPEETAQISIECSDCKFRIEEGLLKVEETGKEIKISPLEFENIKKIEINMPQGESLRYSYRPPTDAELAGGAVEKGGARIRVFRPGVAGLNMLEIISTDVTKALALLKKNASVITPKIVIDEKKAIEGLNQTILSEGLGKTAAELTEKYKGLVLSGKGGESLVEDYGTNLAIDTVTNAKFYDFVLERVPAQYRPVLEKYKSAPETLTDTERQQVLNALVSEESRIYFDSGLNPVNFVGYLADFYKGTGISFEIAFTPIDPNTQSMITIVLLKSKNIPEEDFEILVGEFGKIIEGKKSVQQLIQEYPQYEKEIDSINSLISGGNVPQLAIRRGAETLNEIPIATSRDVVSLKSPEMGSLLGASLPFKNSKGILTNLSVIKVSSRTETPFHKIMSVILHENEHGVRRLVSREYNLQIQNVAYRKLGKINDRIEALQNRLDKGDISSDEFKAEEKILNAQKKDIFDEIEELKGKYAEEIKRETYIKEGAAEDAEYSFYETESQGLEKLGEFNGLDRAAIGDLTANLVTPDEYSVGYLINKTIRKEQPDRAFEILHGTKDIQSVINFDELKNAIESELNAKTLFYAKINLDLSPEKK